MLLDHGAQIHAACSNPKKSPLHVACAYGHRSVVKELLTRGPDIESIYWCCYTPLHMASNNGRSDVLLLLIEAGANIEAKRCNGRTSLSLAVFPQDECY